MQVTIDPDGVHLLGTHSLKLRWYRDKSWCYPRHRFAAVYGRHKRNEIEVKSASSLYQVSAQEPKEWTRSRYRDIPTDEEMIENQKGGTYKKAKRWKMECISSTYLKQTILKSNVGNSVYSYWICHIHEGYSLDMNLVLHDTSRDTISIH